MYAEKAEGIHRKYAIEEGKYGGGVHSDTTLPIFKANQRKLMHKSKGGYNSVHKRVC